MKLSDRDTLSTWRDVNGGDKKKNEIKGEDDLWFVVHPFCLDGWKYVYY